MWWSSTSSRAAGGRSRRAWCARARRKAAYELVRREVRAGRQAFVVCAAIDEANRSQVKAAEQEANRLAADVFPDLRVDVLHGRMRPADKERTMEEFSSGGSDLLISTTVIEVGVDVRTHRDARRERGALRARAAPSASRPNRAGGACLVLLPLRQAEENEEARARLEAMVRTTDGFELADEDLKLRGEGTLFDVRQSGMPDLRLAGWPRTWTS